MIQSAFGAPSFSMLFASVQHLRAQIKEQGLCVVIYWGLGKIKSVFLSNGVLSLLLPNYFVLRNDSDAFRCDYCVNNNVMILHFPILPFWANVLNF